MRIITSAGLAVALAAAALTAVTAGPAHAIPGRTVTTMLSQSNSNTEKSVAAGCPNGRRVIGGGGVIDGAGDGEVAITAMIPMGDGVEKFQVHATERGGGFDGNWSVRAWAICGAAMPGLQVVRSASLFSSASVQRHTVNCPAGKQLLGAGGYVVSGEGQVALHAIGAASPEATGTTIVASEDADGFPGGWRLMGYAVCANEVAGYSVVKAHSPWGIPGLKTATAECPDNRFVHAALFSVDPQPGDPNGHPAGVAVEQAALVPGGDRVRVVAQAQPQGTDPWRVTAIAICAT
jgi:hypothetical protein